MAKELNDNVYFNILDAIRTEAKDDPDLGIAGSIDRNCGRILAAIWANPLDSGIKRTRAVTFCRAQGSNVDESESILLIVRGTTESGIDVKSYQAADSPNGCLLKFAFDIETGGIEWRADEGTSRTRDKKDFFDTL